MSAGRSRSGLNGQVASNISSIVLPPEEQVYSQLSLPLHVTTHNRSRLDETYIHPQTAGAQANIVFNCSNMMLVPRRLVAQYTVFVTIPNCLESIAGSMTVADALHGNSREVKRARNLYTLWPNPLQRLITAGSVKIDGRQLNDDPEVRWMVERIAESHPNITNCKSYACKQVDATHQAVAGLNTDEMSEPHYLKEANENFVVRADGDGGAVVMFDIIEHITNNVFLSEHLSSHMPALHGVQHLEVNMTFGRELRDMVRIIQYGYGNGGDLLTTPGPFSVNISPIVFTIEQEQPITNLLGQPRCSQWFTTAIAARSYKVQQIQINSDGTLKQMFKPATIGLNINDLNLNTVPNYIALWLTYKGNDTTAKTNTGLGFGCSAFISNLSVGLNNNSNQLVSYTQTQLTDMTVKNGGFAMPTNMGVLEVARDFDPDNRSKMPGQMIIPQAGQILVLDPTRDINTPSQMTGGMLADSLITLNIGIAKYKGRMEPTHHDTSIYLTVAAISPGLILKDWSLQSGTTSAIDLFEGLNQIAAEPGLISTGRQSVSHPPAFHGFNAYAGGSFKSFFQGVGHKIKTLAGQVWDGVKHGVSSVWNQATSDPLAFMGKVSDVVGHVAPLLVGAGDKGAKRVRFQQ